MKYLFTLSLIALFSIQLSAQKPAAYQLSVGDKFEVTSSMEQSLSQQVMGQNMEAIQSTSTIDMYEVISVDNGIYRIKTTGVQRKFEINSQMMSMTMDSESDDEQSMPFRLMVERSYEFTMNDKGEIQNIYGNEEVKKEISEELAGTMYAQTANEISSAFDTEALKASLSGQFNIYAVGNEQQWVKTIAVTVNDMPVETKMNFTYSGDNTITAKGDVSASGQIEQMGTMIDSQMAGTQTSVYQVDSKTGLPLNTTITQNMKGEMKAQGMSIPMTADTKGTNVLTMKN